MDKKIASITRRTIAFFIDVIPITIITLLISLPFGMYEILHDYLNDSMNTEVRKVFIQHRNELRNLSFIIYCIYSIFMESSKYQATIGKRLMNIKVQKKDGTPFTKWDAIKRNAFKLVSYIPSNLGFIWAIFSKNNQTWHDYFVGTIVVNKEYIPNTNNLPITPTNLNEVTIPSIEEHQPILNLQEAIAIIHAENLEDENLLEATPLQPNQVVIKYNYKEWLVFNTSERAGMDDNSLKVYQSEQLACEDFIRRLRAHKRYKERLEIRNKR